MLFEAEFSLLHFSTSQSVQSLSCVGLSATHGLQHARLPCTLPSPRACSNSCPSSWWCHPTISCTVIPFSSYLWSFPASGSFPMNQFFTSGGQSIGVSASTSGLPMNIQDWFPLGLNGLISLQSKGLSRVFSNTTVQKTIDSLVLSFLYGPALTSIHDYWKNHSLTRWSFVDKLMSLLFNMLSRLALTFLSRSKPLLISWLTITIYSDFGAQENKACHCFHCFPICLPWSDGTICHDLSFLNVEF